jgi:hypothetical protein
MGLGNFVRNRKQVKADRAESGSHQKLVAAVGKTANVPIDFVAGKGHVSVPSGDGWAGIEGATSMEYKVTPGNPGPRILKRPRKGNE